MSLQSNYHDCTFNQSFMSTIQIRIDEKTKRDAQKALKPLGLNLSSAIKIYLKQIVMKKSLPLDMITENGLTVRQEREILKAADDAMKGKNIYGPFEGDEAVEFLRQIAKKNRK